jgi:DNA-binding NarL/FixJ family response regulator
MLRALVADDHTVVRLGVKQILSGEYSSAQFGEAQDADQVFRELWRGEWDILILDLTLPGKDGLEVLKRVHSMHPRLPVLVLSMHPEDRYGRRVLKAGASGYVNKESAAQELVVAVQTSLRGGKYVSRPLAEKLARDLAVGSPEQPHDSLSDREFQVMCMIASGKTVSQIAAELCLSAKTISTYRSRLMDKMRMRTSAELTRYAVERRLVA